MTSHLDPSKNLPLPGILVLEDGSKFPGTLFGSPVSAATIRKSLERKMDAGFGEAVFNTSMTGYQEILTDPSYYGQLICLTTPHIGNTGTNSQDFESHRPWCAGLIIHELSEDASSWRAQETLHEFLVRHRIPAIQEINTRALTRHLRSKGVIRGIILPAEEEAQASELLAACPTFEGRDLIREVSTPECYLWSKLSKTSDHHLLPVIPSSTEKKFQIVAIDFGIKWNLLRALAQVGCETEVVPAQTSAKDILARKPDGVFLSNGPGDPTAAPYATTTVQELLGKVPIFGVCMGHQILALALGGRAYKLKFGHRGGNQPILNRTTGKIEISAHNHGYAIAMDSLPESVEITHLNLNDQTVEGLRSKKDWAFSVQYHPEACPGPHDSMDLFYRFVQDIEDHVSKVSRTYN